MSGNQSRQTGNYFEELLGIYHRAMRAAGLCDVWHAGTRATIIGGKWISHQSPPDYSGLLLGGRMVMFDAKHRTAPRFFLEKKSKHQTQHLYRVHKLGGLAFLLFLIHEDRGYMVYPEESWDGEGLFSISFDNLPSNAIEVPAWDGMKNVYVPDWVRMASGGK